MTAGRTAWVCGLSAACFAALTLYVMLGDADRLDAAMSQALAPLRSPPVVAAFLAVTAAGSDGALLGMVLVATALLAALSRRHRLLPLWLVFLGTEATTYGLKHVIARPRPEVLPGLGQALTYSFPSAHSAGTAAVIGTIGLIVAVEKPPGAQRIAALGAAGGVALLIGFSRLLLSFHFLTDVLGGFLLALVWLGLGARLLATREG